MKTIKASAVLLAAMLFIQATAYGVEMNLIYDEIYHYYNEDDIYVEVNGERIKTKEMPPIILMDRTLVPVREVFEAVGAQVKWINETAQTSISYKGTEIIFTAGSRVIYMGRAKITIPSTDPAPMIINDKTMVPVRVAANLLGFEVDWDNDRRVVSLYESTEGIAENGSTASEAADSGYVSLDTVGTVDTTLTKNFDYAAVVLDSGHGGTDSGNVSGKADESEINLAIALLVKSKLEADGINVIMTRSDNKTTLSNQERVDIASRKTDNGIPAIFVSIHCNSFENPETNGTQVYYDPDSKYGTILAQNIYNSTVSSTDLGAAQIHDGSLLYVVSKTAQPAALVETGFLSNESDRGYLMSSEGREAMAEGIYRGIMATLKAMKQ